MVQQTSLPLSTMLQGIPSSQHMHTIFAAFSQLNFATVVVAVLYTMQNVAQYQCIFFTLYRVTLMPSVLWRCWLGGRKGIRPVKNWVVGVGMVICLEQGADLHIAQLMLLPLTVSCFSKTQIGFTFLVPAHPDGPGQRAVKRVCSYVETD